MTSINKRLSRLPVFRRAGAGFVSGAGETSSSHTNAAGSRDNDDVEYSDNDEHVLERVERVPEEKALFEGDTSTLPYDVRRTYALLLRGPSLDERHSKLWPVLTSHELQLRQLLHAAFLELVIDREQKVAFTRPVHSSELELPQLLREVRLTFLDTALVLFLRMRLTLADAAGERATASRSEIVDHLKAYEASDNVDAARFRKQIEGAIDKAKKYNFLRLIRNSGDRFEVSPALKLVFSHEQITELLRTYQQIRNGADGVGSDYDVAGDSTELGQASDDTDGDDEADEE